MKCPRCLNTDPEWFYKGSKGWYCRRCIGFGRAMLKEEAAPVSLSVAKEESSEYMLKYPLTRQQAAVAAQCAALAATTDVLLHCVCGAGKTELVVLSIAEMLRRGKKVCFAVPRRQVVLELRDRLAQYFPKAKVIAVCGGSTTVTDGDLILCTTHQLYRYYQAFDLLILDEPDAFPFRGDPVLHGIAAASCKGHTVCLTATPDEELKKRVEDHTMTELVLNQRPHGHPLPVPRIIIAPSFVFIFILLQWLAKHKKHPRIIFVPSLQTAHLLHRFLNLLMNCMVVTSHQHDKDEIIEAFRKKKCGIIVATTVLERGVTIAGTDVCVWRADHPVFDEAGLVQMAGRAGRSFARPDGDVLFLCKARSDLAEACRQKILEVNACAV